MLAIIEKVLSIKFPFIRDLGIESNPFYNSILFITSREKMIPQTKEGIIQRKITEKEKRLINKKKRYPLTPMLFLQDLDLTGINKKKK